MNWNAVGAIAETLGAVAVFLTLVYLSLQIRQNTRAVKSSAVDASINSAMSVRSELAHDADPDSLNPTEEFRYMLQQQNIIWSAWNVYSQAKYSETGVWKSQKLMLKNIYRTSGGRRFIDGYENVLDSGFKSEILKLLDNASDT
jgi:hypothetical protein